MCAAVSVPGREVGMRRTRCFTISIPASSLGSSPSIHIIEHDDLRYAVAGLLCSESAYCEHDDVRHAVAGMPCVLLLRVIIAWLCLVLHHSRYLKVAWSTALGDTGDCAVQSQYHCTTVNNVFS